ncbi:MAG: aconitate hydratase AcnA [Chloroflexi bacterium]|nr:aconitate hydratase AcnA [Chloroflexota bacterium]
MTTQVNPFGARSLLSDGEWTATYYSLPALAKQGIANLDRLPFTVKVLLENALRHSDGGTDYEEDIRALAAWDPRQDEGTNEFPFMPARVLLQDLTGVPAVVDLAAMRSAVARMGGDPQRINPLVPADLVIDHSVQVDTFGSALALATNVKKEYERNGERYLLLRWAQRAFQNFTVVPPSTGIVHQVNLEYLARVVQLRQVGSETYACPDTLVGTDSHTTMVNGMGVLGWGVGGIEAEAVLLGQPISLLSPIVVGFHIYGDLLEGTTATDLVLTVTQRLRKHGVVGKFVEFYGKGLSQLSVADRATLSNMAPEYGATSSIFPVDDQTMRYLHVTGRSDSHLELVERYCKEQTMFRTDETPDPVFSETVELDLSSVEPSLSGPQLPQDRVPLSRVKRSFRVAFPKRYAAPERKAAEVAEERFEWEGGSAHTAQAAEAAQAAPEEISPEDFVPTGKAVELDFHGVQAEVGDGSVVIAAITSCTNTSNPSVMIGAGILAKKAVERGLRPRPWVKSSLAPGSRVVTDYLREAGLLPYLEALRFHLVGYGCTTCIGNSGATLATDEVNKAVREHGLAVAAVLSGNRNFPGRIHPLVRASYLASPPLVVAYALAGSVDVDLTKEPLGCDPSGEAVYLRDIWPTTKEVRDAMEQVIKPELFREAYSKVFQGDEQWRSLPVPEGSLYEWDESSTYVQEPPFFQNLPPEPEPLEDIVGARVLVFAGNSVSTDEISPASSIPVDSPAGQFLIERGVQPRDFNSYGARRGNHEVMVRGTFGNVRLKNFLTPEREGDWTVYLPTGEPMRIFDASQRYTEDGTPLIVLAGRDYGMGSSRDWAAKGPLLLGVKAVIAESYERIHRSNLVGMGILPLQFKAGQTAKSLGLTGRETFEITGIADGLEPGQEIQVRARSEDGKEKTFTAIARVDSPIDVEYLRNGGILQMVLRKLMHAKGGTAGAEEPTTTLPAETVKGGGAAAGAAVSQVS